MTNGPPTQLKSVSHSMKGCSYSAGLTRLGDIFTLLDRQLKDCEAKMNPSTSHGVDVWKQTMQLLTDMAMQVPPFSPPLVSLTLLAPPPAAISSLCI